MLSCMLSHSSQQHIFSGLALQVLCCADIHFWDDAKIDFDHALWGRGTTCMSGRCWPTQRAGGDMADIFHPHIGHSCHNMHGMFWGKSTRIVICKTTAWWSLCCIHLCELSTWQVKSTVYFYYPHFMKNLIAKNTTLTARTVWWVQKMTKYQCHITILQYLISKMISSVLSWCQ